MKKTNILIASPKYEFKSSRQDDESFWQNFFNGLR